MMKSQQLALHMYALRLRKRIFNLGLNVMLLISGQCFLIIPQKQPMFLLILSISFDYELSQSITERRIDNNIQ